MSGTIASAASGRAAAIARRQALSAGKAALPPTAERVGKGRRADTQATVVASPAASVPAYVPAPAPAVQPAQAAPSSPAMPQSIAISGRQASIHRRKLLSEGKQALTSTYSAAAAPTHRAPVSQADAPEAADCTTASCRDLARARRAALSKVGRGDSASAPPSRPPRLGKIDYAPKVAVSSTQDGQRVTGLRIGQGLQVTGDERGTGQPVSGTQYIGTETGAAWRAGGPKVGFARTEGGLTVSGSLVRSQVRITGDEAGGSVTITGEADQRIDDDLTQRRDRAGATQAQFQRQANPHGATVFGTNLGRSARSVGSRDRQRLPALESTESGRAITGSALGRSLRVTGDESGACRLVTGSQYMAPARRQAECGHAGGGTAPAAQIGSGRPDPVTAAKVSVSQSWGGQRITGVDVEHNPRVTGDEPGSCSVLTGSQYQGRFTVDGYCDTADAAGARMVRRPADAAVTGDTPANDRAVTGTARGATRDITGTPYYRTDAEVARPADPVAAVDERFSIRSPQRAAHLRSDRSAPAEAGQENRITGSFAVGMGKVTGNVEFLARSRQGSDRNQKPAHAKISGEGSRSGSPITGDSWADHPSVTGTEGAFAADRNPSERAGKRQNFAGAGVFKAEVKREEPKQLVTGMFGYFSKSGARVTLSGGAQS